MDIPGLSTLYAILKRDIDRKNDVFAQRKELAAELMENCREWSRLLIEAFHGAVSRWETEGRSAAENDISNLERDFLKLNYYALQSSSPILLFLSGDAQFAPFADACGEFYRSALGVKRLVFGDIQTHPDVYVSMQQVGIRAMVEAWEDEVERMLRAVTHAHMHIKTLTPQ